MSAPRISFIVGAFENPPALRTCLSSLLEQTEKDFEIIVVDNSINSDAAESTQSVCWMSERIRYEWTSDRTAVVPPGCRHTRCLYTATEIGVELATGGYLAFPNQDSYYAPVFAERMLRAADATGCDLVYCDFVFENLAGKFIAVESTPVTGRIDKTSFLLRREKFRGFPDKTADYEKADGWMIERLVAGGIVRKRVPEVLCWHN